VSRNWSAPHALPDAMTYRAKDLAEMLAGDVDCVVSALLPAAMRGA
jgi:hypothetical protein